MKVGDEVGYLFGKKREKKVGVIVRLYPKTVYIKSDFPNHKGKIIKRKRHELV